MKKFLRTIFENGIYLPEMTAWLNGDSVPSNIGEHQKCLNCIHKDCKKPTTPGEHRCPEGLSFYSYDIGELKFTLYGILGIKSDHSDKLLKKTSKGRGYPKSIADDWVKKLSNYIHLMDSQIEEAKSEVLHYFHDFIKWANQIHISAEKIVEKK